MLNSSNLDKSTPPLPSPTRNSITLPPILDRLAARAARWPWWLIIIGALLVVVFFTFLTSDFHRRVLLFVTDNPLPTTDRYLSVVYDVRAPDGEIARVRGVLTAQDENTVTILTQPEERVVIPLNEVESLTCETATPDSLCAVGQRVTAVRGRVSGRLLLEDVGRFRLVTDFGDTLNMPKIATELDSQVRIPEGCTANQEGRCRVSLILNDDPINVFVGSLVQRTDETVTIQTVAPESTTINSTDIVEVVTSEPAQCALNNLAACDEGIFLTLSVAVAAFALAVIIGLFFGIMRLSNQPILYNLSTVYVEVVRGVPLLVILLFVNFAIAPWLRDEFPAFVPALHRIIAVATGLVALFYLWQNWPLIRIDPVATVRGLLVIGVSAGIAVLVVSFLGSNSDLPPAQRGIIGLAVGYGAFLAELFRAGIQSISRGQMEAARSLGMNYFQAMRHVILPQAFRVVLPPLGNEFIAILKDTSLIAIIALPELTQKARLFAADTFRPFEPYVTIGVLYLTMTLFLSFLVRTVEQRLALPK